MKKETKAALFLQIWAICGLCITFILGIAYVVSYVWGSSLIFLWLYNLLKEKPRGWEK